MATPRLKWVLEVKSTFKRSFKNLSKEDRERVLEAIKNLQNSEEPEQAGQPLSGKFKGILKYRVGKIRILYLVDRDKEKIVFLDLGQRKSVYHR